MNKIVFNGKFLTAAPTGVHRVADELIKGIDRYLSAGNGGDQETVVLYPTNSRRTLPLKVVGLHKRGALSGLMKEIPWEQVELPWLARKSLLVNLCNLGPIAHGNAMTLIHDAQVYETPASYSRPFRAWYKFLQPLLGRTNRRILTVSDYSKRQLVRYGVASADRITVIHNGCDHILDVVPDRSFAERSGLSPHRYVLALSTTQAHKNIRILLKAFASEAMKDMTLALFGAASREAFEADGFDVPANVRFLGRISDAELAGLMLDACAFACPSTTEGFGLPPLEAMILGCPAIIAPCGALPEVCGDAALIAGPDDDAAWANHIRTLADHPDFHAQTGERGRRHAAAFTWDAAARKLAAAIGLEPRGATIDAGGWSTPVAAAAE